MRYRILSVLLIMCLLTVQNLQRSAAQELSHKNISVLVYTRNGKGFVHENIPYAVDCIRNLGKQHGFDVTVSDTPVVFNDSTLQRYKAIIFANTNNDVFESEEQRLAFRKYIEAGGGFVGIHSVMGTERRWKWFKQMIGGTFNMHAHFQRYEVDVLDANHPSMQGLPLKWIKEDECYFEKEIYPGIHTLAVQNTNTVTGADSSETAAIITARGSFGDLYPAVWWQHFDGGTSWITTLGHDKKDYSDPVYINHLLKGILFVAGSVDKLDYTKAYASSSGDSLILQK